MTIPADLPEDFGPENAIGIQDHSVLKLGLRAPTPGMPRLRLSRFLTGVLPKYPQSADYLKNFEFGLYTNDRYGVCGPTSVANYRRLITANLTGTMQKPTQDDVYDLYRRSGNPNFDPRTGRDDNGVNMQVMLNAVVRGGIGGVKCLGFASVDPSNLDEMDAAVAIFGGLLVGVNLQAAQQPQTDAGVWDYQPSRQWGGHAILDGGYPQQGHYLITWGRKILMTDNFIRRQLSEAWVAIFPEHLQSKTFLEGVNLPEFAAAFTALTNRPFPVPVPEPTPVPTPPPAPSGQRQISAGVSLTNGIRNAHIESIDDEGEWEAAGPMRRKGSVALKSPTPGELS